ncbi:hypothetical protein Hanom_Chr00s160199g01825091 [Helianthus anomalus]
MFKDGRRLTKKKKKQAKRARMKFKKAFYHQRRRDGSLRMLSLGDDVRRSRSYEDQQGTVVDQMERNSSELMRIMNAMGYEYDDGELMRIMNAMYLDVLVYYYKFKTVQGKAIDKKMVEQDKGSSDLWHERRKSDGDIQDEEAIHHYALFAGND